MTSVLLICALSLLINYHRIIASSSWYSPRFKLTSFSCMGIALQMSESLLHKHSAHRHGNSISWFLLRPWHIHLTGLEPRKEGVKGYSRSVIDQFLFYALCVLVLCLGVLSTALSSQWKSSPLLWGPNSDIISLKPCDGWHAPLHFVCLQTPLISNPQVEVEETQAGTLLNFLYSQKLTEYLAHSRCCVSWIN